MESTESKISNLFQDRLFRVPDYQRGYAWEERQCRDFVEDLELLSTGGKHFFGMLILHTNDNSDGPVRDEMEQPYEVYDVVDGQQRLTTLVVYLHALYREMMQIAVLKRIAQRLEERYIATHDANGQLMFKLRLNQDTDKFFRTAVLDQAPNLEGASIRSETLLQAAGTYFATDLAARRTALGEGFADWLRAQYVKVTDQLTVMVYEVTSDADAGIVFETMNNRGKALTELEKVKNYLLYVSSKLELPAEHDLAQEINQVWTLIFRRLMAAGLSGVEDEDRLLRTHWLMAYDYSTSNWEQSRSIKQAFSLAKFAGRHPELLDALKQYLQSLRVATVAYCDVYHPDGPGALDDLGGYAGVSADCRLAADRLSRLGPRAAFLPLLIATRIRYPGQADAYRQALELAERFAFRVYRLLRRRANAGQSVVLRLGHQLYNGRDLAATLAELCGAILTYSPDHEVVTRMDDRSADWFRWGGIKYFLYEYEQHLAREAGQDVRMPWDLLTRKQDTIEHILPQTPPARGYWSKRFSAAEHKRWVHDIGNLTLTYDNSVLSNRPFPEKKGDVSRDGCYASSKLFAEHAIAQYDDWTPATIRSRHQEIAEWALKRWHVEPGFPVPFPTDADQDDVTLIRRVIARYYIPRGQMLLYAALYQAENAGVTPGDLQDHLGYDAQQFSGVMGALGKRINATQGLKERHPGTALLIEWARFLPDGGRYRIRPELKEALESFPRLLQIVSTWTGDQINARYATETDNWWSNQRRDLDLPRWI